jgi:hypothetical protein
MTDPAVIALRCIATRPRTDAAARAGVLSSSARHCPRSGRLAVLLRTGIHRATTENKTPAMETARSRQITYPWRCAIN